MEAIRIQGILLVTAMILTTAAALPVNNLNTPMSARRRVIIYYNTVQPPAASVTNGTARPPIPGPQSLFTASQQSFQARPVGINLSNAIPSFVSSQYVPPTNVPPPSLVPSVTVRAVTAPLNGGGLTAAMLPPLFVPANGAFPGGRETVTTGSPFTVFVPRRLDSRK